MIGPRDAVVVTGGRVVDPARGVDEIANVVVVDGQIAAIGRGLGRPGGARVIDAGAGVAPGLIDLHCHLREPGQEHTKRRCASGLARVAGGRWFYAHLLHAEHDAAAGHGRARARGLRARHGLAAAPACDRRDQRGAGGRATRPARRAGRGRRGGVLRRRPSCLAGRPHGRGPARLGTCRADLSLHEGIATWRGAGSSTRGWWQTAWACPILPAAAEERMIARNVALLEAEGGRIHIAHVSTAGAVELVRAARAGLAISAEATPHHLTLTDDLAARPWDGRPYDTRTKVNPPLRTREEHRRRGCGAGRRHDRSHRHRPRAERRRCGQALQLPGSGVRHLALRDGPGQRAQPGPRWPLAPGYGAGAPHSGAGAALQPARRDACAGGAGRSGGVRPGRGMDRRRRGVPVAGPEYAPRRPGGAGPREADACRRGRGVRPAASARRDAGGV